MFVAQPPIAGQPTKQVSPATPTTWWRWIFCYTNCHWKPQGCGNWQRHAVRSDVCSTCCGCRIHTSNDRKKKYVICVCMVFLQQVLHIIHNPQFSAILGKISSYMFPSTLRPRARATGTSWAKPCVCWNPAVSLGIIRCGAGRAGDEFTTEVYSVQHD